METTVVGSYPVRISEEDLIRAYEGGKDIFFDAVKEAVNDQLSAGIDIVSTGQVRTDMISEFTRKIPGLVIRNGEHLVISKVKYDSSIMLKDILVARETAPRAKEIKATLTGPFTLAKSCRITSDSGYNNEEELAYDFASVLNKEALAVESYVDIIQFDEPFFSQNLPKYGKELISVARKGIKKQVAMHVCGDASKIFKELTEYEVDILDHEFASNPSLLENIMGIEFAQKIGYGCVKSSSLDVESVDEIVKRIDKAVNVLGIEKLILDPDCGLRHNSRDVAYKKLSNMVDARNIFMGIEDTTARKPYLRREDFDSAGYFYILIDKGKRNIRVEHYGYDHTLSRVIHGTNAESILYEILKFNLISDGVNGIRHYGYLGTELQKAEIALKNGLDYNQDKKLNLGKKS